jgi:hypothetical protein
MLFGSILAGSIFSTVFLFSNSLHCLNDSLLRSNPLMDENKKNEILLVNGITMLFSGAAFGYFTYISFY